jgi:uncharacterized protein
MRNREPDFDIDDRTVPPDPAALHASQHWVLEEDYDHVPPDPDPTCRRMAAGQILLVMVIALCLGALFNADRMAERAREKDTDDSWRDESIWIWDRVQDVSEALRLDVPRSAIEDLIGREEVAEEDRVSFGQTDEEDDEQTTPTTNTEGEPASTTTTTEPDAVPVLRRPTAAEPLRLWLGGDSMTQTLGGSMQTATGQTGIIDATIHAEISSGLTRPDFFDWPTYLKNEVLPTDPEVVVIMFGANDSQGLVREDGSVCKRFEQCWLDDYRLRVAGTMDLLRDTEENDRLIVWVGQPIMGPGTVLGVDKINAIYWQEAQKRDWIVYVDTYPLFATDDLQYAQFLPSLDGSDHEMRTGDAIHLSVAGGDRMAWEIIQLLMVDEWVDLSAWAGEPPPSALAPEDVQPRDELPEPTVELIE